MTSIEELIRVHAHRRVAELFKIPIEVLPLEARFGEELKAGPVRFLKENEFDVLDGDIKDAADRKLRRSLSNGELAIRTVSDYCDHMVRCYLIRPKTVAKIIGLPT